MSVLSDYEIYTDGNWLTNLCVNIVLTIGGLLFLAFIFLAVTIGLILAGMAFASVVYYILFNILRLVGAV